MYMFRAISCSSSGGKIVLRQHLVSSLSVSDRPVHRLRNNEFFLNLCIGRSLTVTISDVVLLQVEKELVISQPVLIQHLVSSLSVSDLPVHRLRKNEFFLNLCTGRSLTVTIPDVVLIQVGKKRVISQPVLIHYLVSSLSVSDLPVHRLRKNEFFLNLCTGRSLTVTIPDAVLIQVEKELVIFQHVHRTVTY